MIKERRPNPEILSDKERLIPGSRILYVIDGTDNNEQGGLTNGVKTTSIFLQRALREQGYIVDLLYPQKMKIDSDKEERMYHSIGLPGYPDFDLVVDGYFSTLDYIKQTKPDGIYVASVDAPLGLTTALISAYGGFDNKLPYVASFTTRLDEMIVGQLNQSFNNYVKLLPEFSHAILQTFEFSPMLFQPAIKTIYSGADKIMVPTQTMIEELEKMGIDSNRLVLWPRGIDQEKFHLPQIGEENPFDQYDWYKNNPKPVVIFFGRISLEKNIEVLLEANLPDFHKVIVGKGPHLDLLREKYSDDNIHFLGPKYDEELTSLVRFSNVHAFTSLTDTFGNTILEAGASGVPTVGFSGVPGPQDIIVSGLNGFVINNEEVFAEAVRQSMNINSKDCAKDITSRYSWDKAATTLIDYIAPTKYYKNT